MYEYTAKLQELQVRLRNTELQSDTRKAEVRHLQREIQKLKEDVTRRNISSRLMQSDTSQDTLASKKTVTVSNQSGVHKNYFLCRFF